MDAFHRRVGAQHELLAAPGLEHRGIVPDSGGEVAPAIAHRANEVELGAAPELRITIAHRRARSGSSSSTGYRAGRDRTDQARARWASTSSSVNPRASALPRCASHAARPCTQALYAAAVAASPVCARSVAIMPLSTSPLPAAASSGVPVALTRR